MTLNQLKRPFLTFAFLLSQTLAQAEKPSATLIPLWPGGDLEAEAAKSKAPTIEAFLPEPSKATGAAVIVVPGGGYRMLVTRTEGSEPARLLQERGIAAFVLRYRFPESRSEVPGDDLRRAIRLVRHRANDWGIHTGNVGVWGFSAGGHVAATVATRHDPGTTVAKDLVERQSCRPSFALLFYPVISMEEGITHPGSRTCLLGPEPSAELVREFSNELWVDEQTPPTFLVHASDDLTVPVENSVRFYQSLVAQKIPAELLGYEIGAHGPSAFRMNPTWLPAMDAWLVRRGLMEVKSSE